ncbi:MAG: DUF1588 domain-containing protein [Deltaproteobacteria bacterium]|nr:DUF1588 domain-containing protein [Deltaproteobacteria bacterium]
MTGGPPDEELQQAAAESLLQDDEVLRQHAERLLRSDGKHAVLSFTRAWLGLDALASLQKDDVTFPSWTPDLREAYAAEIEAFVTDVFFEDATPTFAQLFSRRQSRIQEPLAALYDVPGLDFSAGEATIEHLADERAGVLTLAGVQALLAKSDQNSPIARGVFIRERILCEPLPPPPDDVPIIPPDVDPDATTRERFAAHTENPSCASCHWLIDPIGFGFEHYDALGRYRSAKNRFPVDASGEVL